MHKISYKYLIFCLLCLISFSGKSPNIKFLYSLPFEGKFFTTDNLGNIFLIKKDNSIIKFNKKGDKQASVNFKLYGPISQLDVTNPFEIYAYYRDQQTILILDNLLSQRATIALNELSSGEIPAACRSYDNGIWYFDAGNMKLIKTDKALVKGQESMPIATWTSAVWSPSQMLDNDKNLFVHDSTNGIAIYDVFANYYKTVDIRGLSDFQVKKNKIYFYHNHYFQSFDFKMVQYDTLAYTPTNKMVRYDADQMYEWRNDSLFVQSLY